MYKKNIDIKYILGNINIAGIFIRIDDSCFSYPSNNIKSKLTHSMNIKYFFWANKRFFIIFIQFFVYQIFNAFIWNINIIEYNRIIIIKKFCLFI